MKRNVSKEPHAQHINVQSLGRRAADLCCVAHEQGRNASVNGRAVRAVWCIRRGCDGWMCRLGRTALVGHVLHGHHCSSFAF